jgi:hypothetical protein
VLIKIVPDWTIKRYPTLAGKNGAGGLSNMELAAGKTHIHAGHIGAHVNGEGVKILAMPMTDHVRWSNSLLDALDACGGEGRNAAEYLRAHRTRLGFRHARPHVGAFWTPWGSIQFNLRHFTGDTPLQDPRLLTLMIHEVRHLQQGLLMALSVYGELDAWQLQFREYQRMTGPLTHPILIELLSLPLSWDRSVLSRARELMQVYAGKGYRVDLLPLYPLQREMAFLLLRRQPVGM